MLTVVMPMASLLRMLLTVLGVLSLAHNVNGELQPAWRRMHADATCLTDLYGQCDFCSGASLYEVKNCGPFMMESSDMICDGLSDACDLDKVCCGDDGDCCEPSPLVIVLFCLVVLIIIIAIILLSCCACGICPCYEKCPCATKRVGFCLKAEDKPPPEVVVEEEEQPEMDGDLDEA
mmetsp:Transcript_32608/g.87552  ORF Transcript_32608/g.87552 Transcript_32608/m.87552 type:complete len:177 (-) Transcript_32608:111-641(-)|eukprot:CAMPEP_0194479366 /NCGR_PEP_ID=MMETSP0253-20130528/2516_1 /TAXON_ID=2966 /ORGANISM="Noctiluca scintillans" /LENGTH=176 /DNA_ID=CAMNT_0039318583 /DNA_START=50 /DNA_END=580 /DNA_ORIENTATION=+